MHHRPKRVIASYVRNFVFGVEDSLVSTVGLVSGIAVGGVDKQTIVLTGVVLIFVEAFSMAVGAFLSEQSADEYLKRKDGPILTTLLDASVMFVSYFVSGFIPLLPYIFFTTQAAFWPSIAVSLLTLLILGIVSASLFRVNLIRSGIKMMLLGGLAIGVGVMVGQFIKTY